MARKSNIPHYLFGTFIREYRQNNCLTQQKLADRLNMHRTYLSGIERGEKNISFDQVFSIVESLNITLLQLNKIFRLKS
jgi:transcriptional regulator with XRE-family HTH domain